MINIVKADEIAAKLDEYLIIDTRSREEYEKLHVDNAVFLPGNQHLKNGEIVINADEFAVLMSKIGATPQSKILVYGDGDNARNPARFWLVARHYGHEAVFVLDGGWPAAVNLPHSSEIILTMPTSYVVRKTSGFIISLDEILENIDKIKFLDVRTADEYFGRNLVDNPRGGHIPGAVNVDFNAFLAADGNGYFQLDNKIEAIMNTAGLHKDDFIVPY